MVVGLAACGESTSTSGAAAPTSTPTASDTAAQPTTESADGSSDAGASTEVNTALVEWAVNLSQSEVPAGKVKFNVTNAGQFGHNAVVLDSNGELGRTPNFTSAEGPQTFEVDLKPGEYTVICDIPGHPEQGMKTTLVVK
jgi:plastocyanin